MNWDFQDFKVCDGLTDVACGDGWLMGIDLQNLQDGTLTIGIFVILEMAYERCLI